MCLLLLFLFIAVPLIEAAVAGTIAEQVGVGAVLAALLGLTLTGVFVWRGPQRWAWLKAARIAESGGAPAIPTARALVIGVAGGLLVFPGFVTGAIGLLLLIPPLTTAVARWAARRFEKQVAAARGAPGGPTGYWRMTVRRQGEGPVVVDGTAVERDGTEAERATPDTASTEGAQPGGYTPPRALEPGSPNVVEGTVVDGSVVDDSDGDDQGPDTVKPPGSPTDDR